MPDYAKKIVYLSEAQYQELITNQTLTVNGTTINYDENTIYMTPQNTPLYATDLADWAKAANKPTYTAQEVGALPANTVIPEVPVQDVQINGTSILSGGVANVPMADVNTKGVVQVNTNRGFSITDGNLEINPASGADIKAGTTGYKPITPYYQHQAIFYGFAKAAGDTTQSASSNAVGVYTDEAKLAIRTMLGAGTYSKPVAGIPATDLASDVIPVQDVQINGTSILDNGVANIPLCDSEKAGIVKVNPSFGLTMRASPNQDTIMIRFASESSSKAGGNDALSLNAKIQHIATFYGLAKAAGADEKDSTLPVGQYTDTAKTAIRSMIGATSSNVIAVQDTQPTDTDTKIWLPETAETPVEVPTVAEMNTALSEKVEDVQVNGVSVVNNGTANIPMASASSLGVISASSIDGLFVSSSGALGIASAPLLAIKLGPNGSNYRPITPYHQHESVFYGLAQAAGDTTQSESDNAVGTYTNEAKAAIQTMLDVPSASDITVTDVQVNGSSIVNNGIASIPNATLSDFGLVKIGNGLQISTSTQKLMTLPASSSAIKTGIETFNQITPYTQHESVFYGLAKASGDTTQSQSANVVGIYTDDAKASIRTMLGAGTYSKPVAGIPASDLASGVVPVQDVQVDGTSILSNGVANIPLADNNSTPGVVKLTAGTYGLTKINNDYICVVSATDAMIKSGGTQSSAAYRPLMSTQQHASTFYGLAKAAGDTTQSESSNAVGTYTDEAKSAIQTMLGIDLASIASQVEIPLVETISDAAVTITGQPNTRYMCGEVTSISITPPAAGSIDVVFTSGSTVAVLTLPSTVKMPEWFDATTLDANTVYEILITDGVYGSVMTWAV